MLSKVIDFIKYWYFRYTLVTELYMVEKWERMTIHGIVFVFFWLLYIFNLYVVLPLTQKLVDSSSKSLVLSDFKTNLMSLMNNPLS